MLEKIRKRVVVLLWRLLPACKEVVSLISLDRDRGLPFIQRMKVRFHVLICSWCYHYERQLDLMEAELQNPPDSAFDVPPPEVLKRLKKTIQDNM